MGISVYQIQYDDVVIGEFDTAFIKYDCRKNPEPDKRETAHMVRFYEDKAWQARGDEYFGLVSPKFSNKTKICGRDFINWIDANTGYDVYFINPFPQLSYWNFNVWTQGEFWHPGLVKLTNALFTAANFGFKVEELPRNSASSLLYSNYWVGNERFWRLYMTFMQKVLLAVENLCENDKLELFKLAPHYAPATYFPFIFERLFSTFLLLKNDIRSLPYAYSNEEIQDRCSNKLERFVVKEWAGMIDQWDADGREDEEYKKIFANLQGMLKIYQLDAEHEPSTEPAMSRRFWALHHFQRILTNFGSVLPRDR